MEYCKHHQVVDRTLWGLIISRFIHKSVILFSKQFQSEETAIY